jgi:Outer membrane protein beta-barrel domain
MKNMFTIIIFSLVCMTTAFAQDFIVLKTGTEIKCKIVKLTPKEIEYKAFDNLDGPIITIEKPTVFMLRYANGKTETINPIDNDNGGSKPQETEKANSQRTPSVLRLPKEQISQTIKPNKGFTGSVFAGVVIPLGTYSEKDIVKEDNAGAANTGYCLGLQLGYRNKNVSLLCEAQFMSNSYAAKYVDGKYIYNLKGEWTNFTLMPGIKAHFPISEKVSFYTIILGGESFTSLKGDFADLILSKDTKSESFGFGITGGFVFAEHLNIGIKYSKSTPTFDSYKPKIETMQITLGFQF